MTGQGYGPWHVFWGCWLMGSVSVFLAAEIYALVTDWRRTFSAAVWHLEGFEEHQPFDEWTAFHFLLAGILLTMFAWLFCHFIFGLFR